MSSKRVSTPSKSGKSNKLKPKDKQTKPRESRKEKLDKLKMKIQSSNSYKPKENKKKGSKRKTSKKIPPSNPNISVNNSKSKRRLRTSKSPNAQRVKKDRRSKKVKPAIKKEDNDNEYYPNDKDDNNDNDDKKLDLLLSPRDSIKTIDTNNDIDKEGNIDSASSTDGYGLYDYQFLDLMDRMRSSGASPNIPQIVLVGARGCGKTSLLEIITGIALPKGRHNPTVCPIEFNIIRSLRQKNGEISCEMHVKWRFNDETNKWFDDYRNKKAEMFAKIEDISLLNEYIIRAQNMINDSNEHHPISPNSIVVNVYANNVEDIRIVDCPGWIHSSGATHGSERKRYKFYNDIIDIYINKDTNNIVAFMIDVLHDMKECDIFTTLIASYLDKKEWNIGIEHQCIGIVTSLANIHSENELKTKSKWLQSTLKNGFKHVRTFIGIHTFNDYDIQNNVTAVDLKKQEFDLLLNQEPWSYLFDIRSKLGIDNLLHSLGQLIMISIQPELVVWKDKLDHRLKQFMVEFKKLPPTITAKDSTAAISQIVHNFVSEIEQHIKRDSGFERTVNRVEYKFLLLRKEIMATRPRLATKSNDSDIRNGIYSVSDLMKLTKITSGASRSNYNDIIHGVRHFLVESVISARWYEPSAACLSSVHNIITVLLEFLLNKHVHQFVHLLSAIRQTMAELLGKLLGSARKEIDTMLSREKYSPIVDITTLKQKMRYYKMNLKSKSNVFSSGNAQLNENIIEILSQSWAYFDIASNRFCDNIVMVIQSTLIRSLHNELQKCFTQSFLRESPDKLETLLKLDGAQKKRKKQLIQQFKSLTNNRKQVESMLYRNQSLLQFMQKTSTNGSTLSISNVRSSATLSGLDSMDTLSRLIADVESTNPLEQIQPLDDDQLSKAMDDEGYEQETQKMMEQTSMSTGGENHGVNHDELIPADFYSDYIQKKKQLDAVVPKLAQINAQLEAQKRELEKSARDLKKEQDKIQNEKKHLIEQQQQIAHSMDDIEKEYEDLEELRDELDKERETFDQRKEKVMSHIGAARERLESAARRMIEEREEFEREKEHFEAHNGMSKMTGTMDGLDKLTGNQQSILMQQLESQRLLMKQMRDAMIEQKHPDSDYLKDEWLRLEAEKENVATTLQEIEEMTSEITDAEEHNTKEQERLMKLKITIREERMAMDQRDARLKQKEEYLHELEIKLQSEYKKLKEDTKVDESMYRNKVKLLKTKNKLLSSKLKSVNNTPSNNMITHPHESEIHHLSLNIGPETQKDLLQSTFSSVVTDDDFYGDDFGSASDALDTDDSYDMDFYKQAETTVLSEDHEMTPTVGTGRQQMLIPHSTEEELHIVGDTPEPPIMNTQRESYKRNRRSTPVPNKMKNVLPLNAPIQLTSIQSKVEVHSFSDSKSISTSMLIGSNKIIKQRRSVHQNKAKTMDLRKKSHSAQDSVQLQLLTDDMMQEFESLMNEQSKITEEIQDEIHTAFKLLDADFKIYIEKNVELDAHEIENELQQFEDQLYDMEHELEKAEQEKSDLERINEGLNRMVFEMQETDRKKQKIIHKYQEQNKQQVLGKVVSIPISDIKSYTSSNTSLGSNSTTHNPDIDKLNKLVALQPQSYRQYSHNSNPNNPFDDDDTDESDWEVNDEDDELDDDDEEVFELVATNRREFKQSLAHLEKQLHLEHGLEALALDEDEIERLKATHYNKQETLMKLKTIEKQVEEKDKQRQKGVLPPTITEEGAEFDDEESLIGDDDNNSWDSNHGNDNLDHLISPDLMADAMDHLPAIKPTLNVGTTADAINDLINDCDLVSVGMDELEARKILQELMHLKNVMDTPTLDTKGYADIGVLNLNKSRPITPMNPLQQFQHTFQSTKNIYGQYPDETFKSLSKSTDKLRVREDTGNFSDIFPVFSTTSKEEFALKNTTTQQQHGDMLDSMVSNQIELKLQQTQLEAAMTKMELLDELKLEIDIVNPWINEDNNESIRISTIINLDQLADELMN